jgi:hypothetical protein
VRASVCACACGFVRKRRRKRAWSESLGVENELSGSAYQLIKTTRKSKHADHMDMQPHTLPAYNHPSRAARE